MGIEDQYKFWRTLVMGEQGSASERGGEGSIQDEIRKSEIR